jgi:hypothetical protein
MRINGGILHTLIMHSRCEVTPKIKLQKYFVAGGQPTPGEDVIPNPYPAWISQVLYIYKNTILGYKQSWVQSALKYNIFDTEFIVRHF